MITSNPLQQIVTCLDRFSFFNLNFVILYNLSCNAFLFTFLRLFQIVWWIRYLNWFRPTHFKPDQAEGRERERWPKYGPSQYIQHIWAELSSWSSDTNMWCGCLLSGVSPFPWFSPDLLRSEYVMIYWDWLWLSQLPALSNAQRAMSCIKLSSVTDLSSPVRSNNSAELIRHEHNLGFLGFS